MSSPHRLRLLTLAQQRFLTAFLSVVAILLADSLYLVYAGRVDGIGSRPDHLPVLYQAALLAHLILGTLALIAALVFSVWHLRRAWLRRTPGAIPTGLLLLAVAIFLGVSGFFILSAANSSDNRWAFVGHQIAAVALPILYGVHRFRSKDRPPMRVALHALGTVTALSLLFVLLHHGLGGNAPDRTAARPRWTASLEVPEVWQAAAIDDPFVPFRAAGDVDPSSPFFPSATTTTTGEFLPARIIHRDDLPDPTAFRDETVRQGFAASVFLGAQTCQRCHPDVVAQWASSAHRFASFNNPFYRKAVELTRTDEGRERSQWCGGCHDPAIMLAGNMTKEIDPLTPESQAGLTCLACHAIDRIHDNTGNGNYNIQDEVPSPYLWAYSKSGILQSLHDYLVKAKPSVHQREMLGSLHRTSEFCGTCHKVSLDVPVNSYRWIRGQNEYDGWHNSGAAHNNPMTFYEPPTVKTCQDCHMPEEDAPLGDVAAKNGKVKSHRFLGVNTALPHLRGDLDMIARTDQFRRDSLRVEVFALTRADGRTDYALEAASVTVRPGERIQIQVVVRNQTVGHTFPGGTLDSNEGWIDFSVSGPDGPIVSSGAVRDDLHVDPAAHFYQAVLVDAHGKRIERRNPADIHATIYSNVIPPSGSDVARYGFEVPADASGTLRVVAEVRWRKFNQTYTEFVFAGQSLPRLPISVLARHEIQLQVAASPAAARTTPRAPWTHFNDYGIALLLDNETKGAAAAFAEVIRLEPKRVDGYRNSARVALADGDLARAEALMRLANDAAPEDPKNAFFWGRVLEDSGRLEEAVQAYRRTLEVYPDSRDTHERLGMTYWSMGRYQDCLNSMLEVLRIDPESRQAHYRRQLVYEALSQGEADGPRRAALTYAASEARKAFEKYRIDDDAQEATNSYRATHPHENRMSQRIVVHDLVP